MWEGWQCFLPWCDCIISSNQWCECPRRWIQQKGGERFSWHWIWEVHFFIFLFRLFKDQQLHTYHPTKSISPSLSPTTSLLFIYNIKRFTSLNYLSFPSLPSCAPSLSLSPHSSPSCIKLKHVFWNKRTWGDGGIKQPSDAVCSGFIGGNNG